MLTSKGNTLLENIIDKKIHRKFKIMIFPTINHFSVVLVKCSREMLQDLHCLGQFRYCVGLLANFTHQCVEILLQDFNGSVQCLQSGAVKKMWSYQNKSTHKNHRMKCTHLFKKWNSDFFVHWTNFNMCNPSFNWQGGNYQDLLGDLFEWTQCLLNQSFLGSLSSTRIFITQIKGEKQGILFNRIETNDNKF